MAAILSRGRWVKQGPQSHMAFPGQDELDLLSKMVFPLLEYPA